MRAWIPPSSVTITDCGAYEIALGPYSGRPLIIDLVHADRTCLQDVSALISSCFGVQTLLSRGITTLTNCRHDFVVRGTNELIYHICVVQLFYSSLALCSCPSSPLALSSPSIALVLFGSHQRGR